MSTCRGCSSIGVDINLQGLCAECVAPDPLRHIKVFNAAYNNEPAPDAATVDQIMALAAAYTDRQAAVHAGARPCNASEYRSALRAAVERVIAERDALRNRAEIAVTEFHRQGERAERAEAELTSTQAEARTLVAERDALKGLLRKTRGDVDYALINSSGKRRSARADLLARIDAAMKEQK